MNVPRKMVYTNANPKHTSKVPIKVVAWKNHRILYLLLQILVTVKGGHSCCLGLAPGLLVFILVSIVLFSFG